MGGNTWGKVSREPYADDQGSDFRGPPTAPSGPNEQRSVFRKRRQLHVLCTGSVIAGNAAAAIPHTAAASAERFLHHGRFAWLD